MFNQQANLSNDSLHSVGTFTLWFKPISALDTIVATLVQPQTEKHGLFKYLCQPKCQLYVSSGRLLSEALQQLVHAGRPPARSSS